MRPAREGLAPLLEATRFHDPRPPVVTNVAAAAVTAGVAVRDALTRQIDSPVRWVESVRRMHAEHGVERFLEVGPGAVLTGLVRRIAAGAEAVSLAEPAALDELLATPAEAP